MAVVDDQHNKRLSSSSLGKKLVCDISAAVLYCYSCKSCDGSCEGQSIGVARQHRNG